MHEEKDDALHPRLEVRLFGSQWIIGSGCQDVLKSKQAKAGCRLAQQESPGKAPLGHTDILLLREQIGFLLCAA
jgi:hypothetical protein